MNFRFNPLFALLLTVILCFCTDDPAYAQSRLSISGKVLRYDFDPESGRQIHCGPIAGIELTLRGKEGTLTATTDSSGLYRFPGLDSGIYKVTISPSDFFLPTEPVERLIALKKADAEYVNFTMRTNGRVSGKVFSDDGVPLGKIAIKLLPFEYRNSADPYPMKTVSDANGAYYFEGVPEGRYLLGIHLDGSAQHDSRYPRVYYGATNDPDRATVLELGKAERLENIDLQLLAQLQQRIITGIVLSRGTPAAGAWITLKVTEYNYISDGHSIQCDNEGRFSYTATEGIRYSAMAAGTMPNGTPAHSEILQIPASGNVDFRLDLVPAKQPQNLLLNADAGEGFEGQSTLGEANIEGSAGCAGSLLVRGGGYFYQLVHLPQGSQGQYAVLLGIALSEGLNSDGAIMRPPSLYGSMMFDQGRIVSASPMQMRQMPGSEREPDKRSSIYGILRIPPRTKEILVSLNLEERQGMPRNGSAERLDGLGLYLLPTEIEAKLFVQNCFKPPARQVHRRWGVPIASLLRLAEQRLEVVHSGSPPLPARPPNGMSEVAWKTHLSKAVMRARVVSNLPMLNPDEDWIDTSVRVEILQVYKSPSRGLFNAGQEISFMERGGSLDIAGQQIDAIVEWARRFEVGKEYLIFANLTSANELVAGPSSSFEILPGGSLRWLLKTDYFSKTNKKLAESDYFSESSLKNVSLNDVLEEIQRHADADH